MQVYPLRDPIHPSAQMFIQACQSVGAELTSSEIKAINLLVTKLIKYNLWNKFRVIYPFVGRNSKSHSINLRNIFRHKINWFNSASILHNSLGVTNLQDGYGNTYFAPSWLSDQNIHVSVYTGTYWFNANEYCPLVGASSVGYRETPKPGAIWIHAIHLRSPQPVMDNYGRYSIAPIYTYSCSPTTSIASMFAGEDSSDRISFLAHGLIVGVNGKKCFVCGNKFGVDSSTATGFPDPINPSRNSDPIEGDIDYKIYTPFPFLIFSSGKFGNVNTGLTGRANLRFVSFGYSLDENENKIFYDIVNEFQYILGRNVECAVLDKVDKLILEKEHFYPTIEIESVIANQGIFYKDFYDSVNLVPEKEERYKKDALVPSLEIISCIRSGPLRIFAKDGAIPSLQILNFQENS